ncbi:hypothetical protein IP92_01583 [Pseudoduganella flava]|nr:hypothetical protein IP92_01583 [Pseudoduganella flava]
MEKIFAPDKLLDRLSQELRVRSDKQLAKALGLSADVLCQLRRRRIPVTATMLMQMQEVSGVPVDTLRALMGDRRRRIRVMGLSRPRRGKAAPPARDGQDAVRPPDTRAAA